MFEPFNDSVFQTEGSENLSLNMIGNSDDIPSNCLDVNSSGINRRKTIEVNVGDVVIGGDAPISVQSMCNTFTYDVKSTVNQIHSLVEAGC